MKDEIGISQLNLLQQRREKGTKIERDRIKFMQEFECNPLNENIIAHFQIVKEDKNRIMGDRASGARVRCHVRWHGQGGNQQDTSYILKRRTTINK